MWIFSVLLLYEFKNTRKKGDFHCKHLFLTIAPTCNELYRPARSLGERSYMFQNVFFSHTEREIQSPYLFYLWLGLIFSNRI